jgi:hypothetical protein
MTADTSRNVEQAETPAERVKRLEKAYEYWVEDARRALKEARWDDAQKAIRARGEAEVTLIEAMIAEREHSAR